MYGCDGVVWRDGSGVASKEDEEQRFIDLDLCLLQRLLSYLSKQHLWTRRKTEEWSRGRAEHEMLESNYILLLHAMRGHQNASGVTSVSSSTSLDELEQIWNCWLHPF